jgi:hypothetical protein
MAKCAAIGQREAVGRMLAEHGGEQIVPVAAASALIPNILMAYLGLLHHQIVERGNINMIPTALEIIKRLCALRGLDAPQRQELRHIANDFKAVLNIGKRDEGHALD